MKAVKSNPDPSGVAFQPIKLMRSSTGVCLNGFFVFHALLCLRRFGDYERFDLRREP